jgi:hypothetical protein
MTLAAVLGLGVLAPLCAPSDAAPDEIEANRVRLIKMRDDPAAYAELMRQTRDFLRLPEQRREQMVQLDQDLRQQDPAKRARLTTVLKRYANWQQRLNAADLKRLGDAATGQDRLRVVRELRERDWVRRFPKVQRDQLARLSVRERTALIRQIRQERQRQKAQWQLAGRFWEELMKKVPLPTRLTELPPDIRAFFDDYLKPRLSPEELAALAKAEGRWPDYPRQLVAVADRHPPALPGSTGPRRLSELPEALRFHLRKGLRKFRPKLASDEAADKVIAKNVRNAEGKWPEFGTAVTDLARRNKILLPHELWPSRYFELSMPVRQFVEDRLKPALTPDERKRLDGAVFSWPRFPQAIQELASAHGLRVPWHTLPGPTEFWNKYRFDVPEPVSMLWQTPRLASPLLLREP